MYFADSLSNAVYFLYFVLISLYRRFYNFSVSKTEFEAELFYILQLNKTGLDYKEALE